VLFAALSLIQHSPADTLTIRPLARPPSVSQAIDTTTLGAPQVLLRTRQGQASLWLLRASDTLFITARIPDSSRSWADELVMSLDTHGDGSAAPDHDDFQWSFRRLTDSSIVFRGRNGRWEPPRGDPDWRLGSARSGGGWEVSTSDETNAWTILLRLDPAWLEEGDQPPRIAFRIYDNAPQGWFAWPVVKGIPSAVEVERTPSLWALIR
jgi:hypothetical protein